MSATGQPPSSPSSGRASSRPTPRSLRADDAGLTRGDGCFEGCRLRVARRRAGVDKLDAHLARMARSAAALEIGFDAAPGALLDEAAAAWVAANPAPARRR